MHIGIRHSIELTGEPLGVLEAECPHCHLRQSLVRRRLLGRINFIPIRAGEALVCPSCGKCSRNEGIASRVLGVIVLIPFALALAAGSVTGIYFLVSMPTDDFSFGFAAIGLFLVLVAGYLEYRTLSAIRRFLRPRDLLPLAGLHTDV